jgi:ketosteroid isomerase-like protein
MSQENVEIARKSLEAFRRGEFDLATEPWDPAGEWIPAMAGAVEDKVYRGHADLRRYFEELFESFSEVRPDDMEFRDLGNRVLVLYTLSVRGRDSGVAINQPGGIVYEMRGGKIVQGRSYLSPDEAFDAAGLSEQDAHADS